MSRRSPFAPWQVWWVQFTPQVGREQAGHRPAVVVGTKLMCDLPNGLVPVVPCTTTNRRLAIHPEVDLDGRPGVVLCDQIKALSVDRFDKPHPARLTDAEIDRIRFVLRQLIDV
ncbi:mRNA interferase MazF [Stackebrandtia albiflava]|uniref:mRNA interferase MazF n=1 Tax=Stackebrandtia albiflava TaxID=406432 RepID=A0A562V4Z7_9ACTN|nr:type II toxin-antitoxin system PemK/MazF family toxin [Stackebrandtia albiflava]TWJ12950.1 mRNA interferase MazF [Stackebrandtia albiflava]